MYVTISGVLIDHFRSYIFCFDPYLPISLISRPTMYRLPLPTDKDTRELLEREACSPSFGSFLVLAIGMVPGVERITVRAASLQVDTELAVSSWHIKKKIKKIITTLCFQRDEKVRFKEVDFEFKTSFPNPSLLRSEGYSDTLL